ncbi:MAG: DUF3305 domain-containing protein [Kiloniellales bacterium]
MPDGKTLKGQARVPLGIVVERRAIDNPWIDYRWKAVAVIPGAAPLLPQDEWTLLGSGRWAFGDSRGMDAMVDDDGFLACWLRANESCGRRTRRTALVSPPWRSRSSAKRAAGCLPPKHSGQRASRMNTHLE